MDAVLADPIDTEGDIGVPPHAPSTPSPHPPASSRSSSLDQALEHASHYLPMQAPLEVFVHHNTLHAFQHLPFFDGLRAAQDALDVRCLLPEEAYRQAWQAGRIRDADVAAVLAEHAPDPAHPTGRGWSQPWPQTLPPVESLRRLIVLYGLQPTTPAGLRFLLTEQHVDQRFRADLPGQARDALLSAARAALAATASPASDAARQAYAVSTLWDACCALSPPLEARPVAPPPAPRFHRDLLVAVTDEDPDLLVHPVLIPLCAAFLDHGQAHWQMPDRSQGFYAAWRSVLTAGHAVRPAWERRLGDRLRQTPDRDAHAAVLALLDELGIGDDEVEPFVTHVLLRLRGWAGIFRRMESSPQQVGISADVPKIRLVDFLAVRLSLDVLAHADVGERAGYTGPLSGLRAFLLRQPRLSQPAAHGLHDTAWPLFQLCQLAGIDGHRLRALGTDGAKALLRLIETIDEPMRLELWHRAFERTYRDQVLAALAENWTPSPSKTSVVASPPPSMQVVCCIDDRMESFRRHLEEQAVAQGSRVETFGAAGFFNLAIAFQGIDDPTTFPLCPVVVTPQHKIIEQPDEADADRLSRRLARRRRLGRFEASMERASRSLLFGPLLTALYGFVATVPLLLNVFAPRAVLKLRHRMRAWVLPEVKTHLTPPRPDDERAAATEGLFAGFSIDEMANRVGTLLENIGLVDRMAPLVVILGHDSASANNPHIAAYSCGACGGRSGGPNARLFARMANLPDVRALLRTRGIHIPDSTLFIGGVHDTCTDQITLYDEAVPAARTADLTAAVARFDVARALNAQERCRRFISADPDISAPDAIDHVERRSADLGQARPELGHATNASCIVGRRHLSQGTFLDRRAFLVSYDPTLDRDGSIIERILNAVGPVGAGINLEYFFSTVDNERLGAGTKLPHNVTSLLGVMNGACSDLRTGLPKQMIEIHEPVRLQLILEARLDHVARVLERQPAIAELVQHEWVCVSTIDPDTGAIHVYDGHRGLVPWQRPQRDGGGDPSLTVPRATNSYACYRGHRGHLPAMLIRTDLATSPSAPVPDHGGPSPSPAGVRS